MSAVSRTAQYVALYRALETMERSRPPLFTDRFALRFLSPQLRLLVALARGARLQRWLERAADRRAPGARTSAIARTAFIDGVVREAVGRGVAQLVLLGAGFDCRAHRMPELAGARVFEVDRAATQAVKRARLPRGRVVYVPVDFLREDAFTCLARAGFRRDVPALFVWEGVTNYLSEAAVLGVLRAIGACAAGTRVVFTYIHRGVLDGSAHFEGADRVVRRVRALGEPWTYGILPEALEAWLAGAGLALCEDLGADDYRARVLAPWGADPSSPLSPPGARPESCRGYAFYRLAVADTRPSLSQDREQ